MLKADAPAAVAAFDEVNPAGAIAAVRIVVAGEEIAVIVERKFLRIAQAQGENFQAGSICVAAKNGAGIGVADRLACAFYGRAPIADRKIQASVRSANEPM